MSLAPSPGRVEPLVRLAALQSLMNAGLEGPSGCPRPRRRRDFSRVPVAGSPASSPVLLRKRVHPLVSFVSPSEYVPLRTCPEHGCSERLPWGLVPNRDMSSGDPHASEVPPSPFGPSSTFHTSSTVFAHHCLGSLFHPPTTSGIHLSGVRSHRQAGSSRRRSVPSCRWSPCPVASCPATPAPMTSPSGR